MIYTLYDELYFSAKGDLWNNGTFRWCVDHM